LEAGVWRGGVSILARAVLASYGVDADRLAVLRLDGDMYESTFIPLEHLYDRLSPGGWLIVDDYQLMTGCRKAVRDFFGDRGIKPRRHDIDLVGVYFRKE
jgi:O-methyltransferase